MASIGSLFVRLGLDVPGFQRDTKRAQRLTKQFKGKWQRDFSSMKKSVFSLRGALLGLGAGVVFKSILDNTIEQEAAFRQVQQAIVSTGGAAGLSAKEIEKMAAGFQDVTTFGDEAILRVQSKILTFTGITKKNFGATTEAVLDLATRMQGDLNGAVVQLGKVLNDPVANLSALSRVGIQFTESQKSMILSLAQSGDLLGAQSIILKELSKEFGGSARAARDTFGGALKSLGNAFGDLLEGKTGLKQAQKELEGVTKLLQDPKMQRAADNLTSALIAGFSNLIALLVPVSRGIDGIRLFIDGLALSVLNAFDTIVLGAQKVEEVMGKLPGSFGAPYRKAAKDIGAFRSEIDLLRNGISATGAKDLSAVLGDPVKFSAVGIEHKKNAQAIGEEVKATISLASATNKATDAVSKLPKETKKASAAAQELGITFSSAFEDAIISGNKFSDVLKGLLQDILRIIARKTVTEPLANAASSLFSGFSFGSLLGFADGGQPPVGVPSIVGERGPEVFVPRTAGTIIPNGGGGDVTINQSITVNGNGDAALAHAVEIAANRGAQQGYAMVNNDLRRNGPLRSALA